MSAGLAFRFDAVEHQYIPLDTEQAVPHITGMLKDAGEIDDDWFTEESSARGRAVHKLTADYDLDALDVDSCTSRYRGYLLGHVAAAGVVGWTWEHVEVPRIHSVYRYGGRPDRRGRVYAATSVCEIKSGAVARGHEIQTALQAILEADDLGIPPWAIDRYALYLTARGKWKLLQHKRRRDFDRAFEIIREYCL